jgi:hypothetical protein
VGNDSKLLKISTKSMRFGGEGGIRTHDTEVRVVFGLGSRAVADHFSSDPEFPRKNGSFPAVKPGR